MTPPWEAFFLQQAEQNETQKLKETPQQHKNCLTWEKAPPIKAKMFQWIKNNLGVRERVPVAARKKADVLEFDGSKQKRFDSLQKNGMYAVMLAHQMKSMVTTYTSLLIKILKELLPLLMTLLWKKTHTISDHLQTAPT